METAIAKEPISLKSFEEAITQHQLKLRTFDELNYEYLTEDERNVVQLSALNREFLRLQTLLRADDANEIVDKLGDMFNFALLPIEQQFNYIGSDDCDVVFAHFHRFTKNQRSFDASVENITVSMLRLLEAKEEKFKYKIDWNNSREQLEADRERLQKGVVDATFRVMGAIFAMAYLMRVEPNELLRRNSKRHNMSKTNS